jgi:hypothetical protein
MTRLNATALSVLRESGVSPSMWARANWCADGTWTGDRCGCPDDRCTGHRHDEGEDCGCLETLLPDFLKGTGLAIFDPAVLPPVRRSGDTWYRPRKLTAEPVHEDDEMAGVIVFGTHSLTLAQPLADALVVREIGAGWRAVWSGNGWWRDGFEHGQRRWLTDDINGRAGVLFGRIEETGGQ